VLLVGFLESTQCKIDTDAVVPMLDFPTEVSHKGNTLYELLFSMDSYPIHLLVQLMIMDFSQSGPSCPQVLVGLSIVFI
jgi:hypothetical protein